MVFSQSEEDLRSSGVYRITNTINNKIYIGSTTQKFRERWSSHERQLRKREHTNSKLQNAWNKYGEAAFEFSVIEKTSSCRKETIEKEQYWINLLTPKGTKGYNICKKAGVPNPRKFTREERIKNRRFPDNGYVITYPTGEQITTTNLMLFCELNPELELSYSSLCKAARGKVYSNKGFLCTFLDPEKRKVWKPKKRKRGILKVIAPTGEVFETDNLEDFVNNYEGDKPNARCLNRMSRGEIKNHKGWQCEKLNSNSTTKTRKYRHDLKHYVLFDPEGTKYEVENVPKFCKDNPQFGLQSCYIYACANKLAPHIKGGWTCYHKHEAPTEFIPLKNRYKYRLTSPEGEVFLVESLSQFAKEKNLNKNSLWRCSSPKYTIKTHKSWACDKIL